MFTIFAVESGQYLQPIRDIFWEYLLWVNENVCREYGISFDIAAILEGDMRDLGKFMPPPAACCWRWSRMPPRASAA